VKPPQFDYHAPGSIEEAVTLLGSYGGDAKVLAGGQSLIPVLNFRLARPGVLIDINRIGALSFIREADGGVAIGATTRQRMIEGSDIVGRRAPLLADATRLIGHLPIRTRGTIGGSLSHADPAAEDPAVVTALDATMVALSKRGERRVPASGFFRSLLTTALEPDELLVRIEFPPTPAGTGTAFVEISRRHGDFALAGVAAQVTLAGDRASEVRLAACGAGPGPIRLAAAEKIVRDGGASAASIEAAAAAAAAGVEPTSDVHASAAYRRDLVRAMTRRALERAVARAAGGTR